MQINTDPFEEKLCVPPIITRPATIPSAAGPTPLERASHRPFCLCLPSVIYDTNSPKNRHPTWTLSSFRHCAAIRAQYAWKARNTESVVPQRKAGPVGLLAKPTNVFSRRNVLMPVYNLNLQAPTLTIRQNHTLNDNVRSRTNRVTQLSGIYNFSRHQKIPLDQLLLPNQRVSGLGLRSYQGWALGMPSKRSPLAMQAGSFGLQIR